MLLNVLICKYLLLNFVKSFEIQNTDRVISILFIWLSSISSQCRKSLLVKIILKWFIVRLNYTVRHFDWFRLKIFWRKDVTNNNIDASFFFTKQKDSLLMWVCLVVDHRRWIHPLVFTFWCHLWSISYTDEQHMEAYC